MKVQKSPSLVQFWYLQVRKHWLAYLCGFLFWFPTFAGVFRILRRLPCNDFINAFYSAQFALPRYGIYIAIVVLLLYTRKLWFAGIWATLSSVLNILFFPFVAAALVTCGIIQAFDLTLFSLSKVYAVFFSAAFFVGSLVVWPLCVYILQDQSASLLILFMVLLGLASLRLLIEVFALGAQPLRLVDELLKYFVPQYLARHVVLVEDLLQLEEHKFSTHMREQREKILRRRKLKRYLEWYANHRGTPQFVTSAFIAVFILAFVLAAFTFAVEYDALQRLSPGSLQGLPTKGFFDCLFLSVMCLSTSSPEGVVAATPLARAFVALETLTGIGLLVFLIQCFSVIVTRDLEEGRACAQELLNSVRRNIAEREGALQHPEVRLRYRNMQRSETTKVVRSDVASFHGITRCDRLLPPGEGEN